MTRAPFALVVPLVAALFAGMPSAARAQGRPEVRAGVDADSVAVGDGVELTLEAMSSGAMPSDPRPGQVPPAFSLHGVSQAPSTSISIVNGVRSDKRGLTVTWHLRAERPGTYRIGPPSIQIGKARYAAPPVTVTVAPPGQAPRRPRSSMPPNLFAPFDPFQGFFHFDDEPQANAPEVKVDPKLALDAPRGAGAFLHATVDKTTAVVGEQVTFTVYLYEDASVRSQEIGDVHEAPANDFIRRALRDDDSRLEPVGVADVAGRPWTVKLFRKSALFPLKSGLLDVGAMTVGVATGRMRGATSELRASENLDVRVVEPPVAGRPPGYAVGDVGRFQLTAQVDRPRGSDPSSPPTVERGGALGVTIELSGIGNLPAQITPPQRPGVEWLEPQVSEKLGPTANDEYGGTRTFAYVVRFVREGEIDLGEVTLPYWDPKANAYGVARASLGVVRVTPGASVAPQAGAPADPLPGLPALRTSRLGASPAATHLTDAPLFWWSLALPTLAFAFAVGGRELVTRVRARRAEQAVSPLAEARARVAAAERAAAGTDVHAIDAATVRALEASTIAHTGVNVRGVPLADVEALLTRHGVDAETAREVPALLRACEAARFSAGADGAEGAHSAKQRWARASQAILRLAGRA